MRPPPATGEWLVDQLVATAEDVYFERIREIQLAGWDIDETDAMTGSVDEFSHMF